MDFWKKKNKQERHQRETFFPPLVLLLLPHCSDQPSALDTAVRRRSDTLTLSVPGDSGRMNHGAEVHRAHLETHNKPCGRALLGFIHRWR